MRTTMVMVRRAGSAVVAILSMAGTSRAAVAPPALADTAAVPAADFRVTTFASGLAFPTSMQQLSDGSLLVGSSVPGSNYFDSTGQLLRFTDANHDGVADGPPTVLASGLPGVVSSVRVSGDLVFVVSAAGTPTLTILRQGLTPAAPLTTVGSVQFNYPAGWSHVTSGIAVRATPGSPGSTDVVFNVGSEFNAGAAPAGTTVTTSGLVTASLSESSLYMMTVTDTGSGVTAGSVRQVATGLRNAAGSTFAANGNLILDDNGIDGTAPYHGSVAPLSADELNVVSAADLANGTVPNFGFPSTYVRYSDGQTVGSTGTPPVAAFLPVDGHQTVGPNEVSLAPAGFPAGLTGGVFVGFHGEFDDYGDDPNSGNDENGVAYVDPTTGVITPFLPGDQSMLGHTDGLLATGDSLFVSDLGDGSLYSSATTGAIYEVTAVPEPTVAGAAAVAAVAAALRLSSRQSRRRSVARRM
jgi:glucose/arabinose dehydrogenase